MSALLWFGFSSPAPAARADDTPDTSPINSLLDGPFAPATQADPLSELATREDDERGNERRGRPHARGDHERHAHDGERGHHEDAHDDDRHERQPMRHMGRRDWGGDEWQGPPRFGGMRGWRRRGFDGGGYRREFPMGFGPGALQGGSREVVHLLEDLRREIADLRYEVRQLREARDREEMREERRRLQYWGERRAERRPDGLERGPRGPFRPGMRGDPRRLDGPPDGRPERRLRRSEEGERRPDDRRDGPASGTSLLERPLDETAQPASTGGLESESAAE